MSEIERGGLDLGEEDRLPWLEAVEPEDDAPAVSPARVVAGVTAALAALGLVIGGIWWLKEGSGGQEGDGSLIAAPEGEYKEKPADPGGMEVEGQGDTSFAASDGAEAAGQLDPAAMPETPVERPRPAPVVAATPVPARPAATPPAAPASKPRPVQTAKAETPPQPRPAATTPPPTNLLPAAAGGGSVIQLGAFGSEAGANQAWANLSKRFAYLAPLSKIVVPVSSGGKTVYRLRASAGSPGEAASLCGKLKVAGENCLIPSN